VATNGQQSAEGGPGGEGKHDPAERRAVSA
jgi:hypothetical protein